MAKISALPLLVNPTGAERVPVVDGDGVTRRAQMGSLVEAAAAPSVARASAEADRAASTIEGIYGKAVNLGTSVEPGYINKSTGAAAAENGYRRTGFIPVSADTELSTTNITPLANSNANAANIVAYDTNRAYLGWVNFSSVSAVIRAGDIHPDVAFVRVSNPATSAFSLFAKRLIPSAQVKGLNDALAEFSDITAFFEKPDLFLDDAVSAGYIARDTGAFTPATAWRSTDFIKTSPGSRVVYTGTGSSIVAGIATYDANKVFLGHLVSSNAAVAGATYTIPAGVAFIRASAQASQPRSFFAGVELGEDQFAKAFSVYPTYFAPAEGYALKGERLSMYARGICADRAFDLAWNISEANERLAIISSATAATVTAELVATDRTGVPKKIASFPVYVCNTPVNPAAMRNIIHFGDSTVEGISPGGTIVGAVANEVSRRLNGTGTPVLSGAQSPAPFALSNMRFIGTLGNQPVKHEGRGGWRAAQYVQLPAVGGVPNAFWNSSTSKFDLAYYLAQNGLNAGTLTNGVNATGSNLTIIIQLGWNDVYERGAAASKANMAALIDAIHATHADVDIIVVGLPAAPQINIKSFADTRFVSERRIFEDAVRSFGEAYRQLATEKPRTSFLQISHVVDPQLGFATTTRPLSIRSAEVLAGTSDHVHPNAVGYAMYADAIFYKLVHKYCQ